MERGEDEDEEEAVEGEGWLRHDDNADDDDDDDDVLGDDRPFDQLKSEFQSFDATEGHSVFLVQPDYRLNEAEIKRIGLGDEAKRCDELEWVWCETVCGVTLCVGRRVSKV